LKIFSASLTNLTVLLPQSIDCSCYVGKQKITGTSTALTAETHRAMRTRLRALFRRVTSA